MNSDFGAVATAVSDRWRDMDTLQREPYEEMAKEDRERFQREVRMGLSGVKDSKDSKR